MANALDLIDEQLQKAAAPKSTGKPIFLFLKSDEKFLIRPLFDLKDSVVLMKHNLWSEDPSKSVNSICAAEEGNACLYCQQAQNNKKLTAKLHFYLPVYVYKGVNQKTQSEITYEETQEDGSKQTKSVKGIRLLELAAFGATGDILKWLREFVKEDDNCALTECDFALSQVGKGTTKTFIIQNKNPKQMSEQIAKLAKSVNLENVKARVLEARAPFIAESSHPARGKSEPDVFEEDKIHSPEGKAEELDDTIMDW
jgi:hypothetical protein